MNHLIRLSILLSFISSNQLMAQPRLTDPFYQIAPSPESNGMGGISSTLLTQNALTTSYNPGQLALFALGSSFNASAYTSRPQIYYVDALKPGPVLSTWAGAIGLNLGEYLHSPWPLSLGIGYSRRSLAGLDYQFPGQFKLDTNMISENQQIASIGFGVDKFIQFGIGVNFKYLEWTMSLAPGALGQPRKNSFNASAWDFGAVLKVPLLELFTHLEEAHSGAISWSSISCDMIFSYNLQNVGHGFVIIDAATEEPFPRNATLGLGFQLGVVSHQDKYNWTPISLTAVREANDLLVRFVGGDTLFNVAGPGTYRVTDTYPEYQGLTGAIQFFKNVIMGQGNGKVEIRNGLQLKLFEALALRRGWIENGTTSTSTYGFGLQLSGFLKFIDSYVSSFTENGPLSFAVKHLDLQFDYAHYNSSQPATDDLTFESLNFVVK